MSTMLRLGSVTRGLSGFKSVLFGVSVIFPRSLLRPNLPDASGIKKPARSSLWVGRGMFWRRLPAEMSCQCRQALIIILKHSSAVSLDSLLQATGKENTTPERFGSRQKKAPPGAKAAARPVAKVLGVRNKESVQVCNSAAPLSSPSEPLDRNFSNTTQAGVKKSNRKFDSSTSSSSCPMRKFDSRISFGPLVKTKTGLVPAVIQASHNKRHASVTQTVPARPVVGDRTAVTASRGPTGLSNTKRSVLKGRDEARTAVASAKGAKIKIQGQNKASTHLHLDKAAGLSKGQQTNQQKSISTANKQDGRLSRCTKSTTQPTNVSRNPKSEVKVGGKGHPCVVPARTSTSAAAHRPKNEQVQKNKTSARKDDKVGRGSANAQPQQRTVAAKPGRAVGVTSQSRSTRVKVPDTRIPQPAAKKQTAAQAERM